MNNLYGKYNKSDKVVVLYIPELTQTSYKVYNTPLELAQHVSYYTGLNIPSNLTWSHAINYMHHSLYTMYESIKVFNSSHGITMFADSVLCGNHSRKEEITKVLYEAKKEFSRRNLDKGDQNNEDN